MMFMIFFIAFILFVVIMSLSVIQKETNSLTLTKIDDHIFLELESLAYARFADMENEPKAFIHFIGGGAETVTGEGASVLYSHLNDGDQPDTAADTPAAPSPLFGVRTKAWFHRVDETGRGLFMAFINAKGSCSMRTFDAEKGIFISRRYRAGNYQDQFAELIKNATELTVSSQPNLERDCKERLPAQILAYLRKQISK
jgi:hypothetical protein